MVSVDDDIIWGKQEVKGNRVTVRTEDTLHTNAYVRYGAILRVMFSSTCTSAFTARVHVLENMFRREVYFDE